MEAFQSTGTKINIGSQPVHFAIALVLDDLNNYCDGNNRLALTNHASTCQGRDLTKRSLCLVMKGAGDSDWALGMMHIAGISGCNTECDKKMSWSPTYN